MQVSVAVLDRRIDPALEVVDVADVVAAGSR
jgi:hypothetical protein